jgi:hypothetical protein
VELEPPAGAAVIDAWFDGQWTKAGVTRFEVARQ